MKNHIAFKFLAVLVCAVTLLGAVGSAGGILVLTQMDLYNKTVDQVVEEEVRSDGEAYANILALRCASRDLGNCPEDMVRNRYTTGSTIPTILTTTATQYWMPRAMCWTAIMRELSKTPRCTLSSPAGSTCIWCP